MIQRRPSGRKHRAKDTQNAGLWANTDSFRAATNHHIRPLRYCARAKSNAKKNVAPDTRSDATNYSVNN